MSVSNVLGSLAAARRSSRRRTLPRDRPPTPCSSGSDGPRQRPGTTVLIAADRDPEFPRTWPHEAHRSGSLASPWPAAFRCFGRTFETEVLDTHAGGMSSRRSVRAGRMTARHVPAPKPRGARSVRHCRPSYGPSRARGSRCQARVMLTSTVDLTLKTRRKVFRLSTHELSVSIRCIERRIWVETLPVSVRYAESRSASALNWAFECAPRDSNPKPAD